MPATCFVAEQFGYNVPMPPPVPTPFTTIGPVSIRSFTLLIAVVIVLSMALTSYINRHRVKPVVIIETTIVALIFGIAGARLGHVLLHWDHFAEHASEIVQLRQGGLNWHGAFLGSWLGFKLCGRVTRWQDFIGGQFSATIAFVIPIFTLAAWRACISARCAYGREIETLYGYPAWLADWSSDIFTRILPRYNTASLGSLLACAMFVIVCYQTWRNVSASRRWLTQLAMLSAGMWFIGELRGDPVPTLAGQRADQWLDLLILLITVAAILRDTIRSGPSPQTRSIHEESQWQTTT